MENKKLFEKYRARLVREGVIRSALWGVISGCTAIFAVAVVCWLSGFESGVWLALGLGVGLGVACGVALYFLKYKPTEKDVARRVDSLGLEERMITMLEFENDDSYLAQRQREDARERLHSADHKKITFKLSVSVLSALVIAPVAAAGMLTVGGLVAGGIIPTLPTIVNPETREDLVEVTYLVDGDGEIDGDELQVLAKGEYATPVKAVSYEAGWVFDRWDDNSKNPYRDDGRVYE
ncbi:MAG: hypothetical protein K2N74_02525, partial [Clostridiales bacterium]|nr:hypothetical protein [Clostridiales bacterium]